MSNIRPLAKILLTKFWDGLEAHPTRKKIFVGWASSPISLFVLNQFPKTNRDLFCRDLTQEQVATIL
ncbi:MAG: hypothetical protein EAZ93_19415 [Oscillatoriales cyanobacterium]|nr:MAG: hypothetical protein EAZ93_19415 [Oscillatoriales cyanobacterium]